MQFRSEKQKIIFLWIRVLLWCGLIYFLSDMPDFSGRRLSFDTLADTCHFLSRKAAHLTEYLILMIFFFRAVQNSWHQGTRWHFLCSFLFVLFYAISDEWHQTFIFGRSGNSFDVLIDSVGGLGGYFFYLNRHL